jgi:hypothetical protein
VGRYYFLGNGQMSLWKSRETFSWTAVEYASFINDQLMSGSHAKSLNRYFFWILRSMCLSHHNLHELILWHHKITCINKEAYRCLIRSNLSVLKTYAVSCCDLHFSHARWLLSRLSVNTWHLICWLFLYHLDTNFTVSPCISIHYI